MFNMGKRGPKPKKLIETKWSANLAYAIGLLATDGCIARGTTLVDLTSKDREQLDNFNYCIGLKLKIGSKISGYGKFTLRVQIKNRIFYDFLVSIGFTAAKSKTIGQIKIPDQYYFDFLRGCFDGDGSFYSYWDKRWKSSFMFYLQFASASKEHIQWIRSQLSSLLKVRGHVSKKDSESTYQLRYAKKESLIILDKMYHSKNVICLSRKRLKIGRALGSIGLSVKHLSRSTRQNNARVLKLVDKHP